MGRAYDSALSIVALGGVRCASLLWRAHHRLHASVIVKAGYTLRHGEAMAPSEVLPPVFSEEEMIPYLGQADAFLSAGHAFAPQGSQSTVTAARLAVFRNWAVIDRSLLVYGAGAGAERKPLFRRVPLLDKDPQQAAVCVDPYDPSGRTGFGPWSKHHPQRLKLLRGKPEPVQMEEVVEIPPMFPWSYYQRSPGSQRCDYLHGNEWVVLDGMHPEQRRIQSHLPGARVHARIYARNDVNVEASWIPIQMVADCLTVDADLSRCTVTWRGSFPLSDRKSTDSMLVAVGLESWQQPLAWPSWQQLVELEQERMQAQKGSSKHPLGLPPIGPDDLPTLPRAMRPAALDKAIREMEEAPASLRVRMRQGAVTVEMVATGEGKRLPTGAVSEAVGPAMTDGSRLSSGNMAESAAAGSKTLAGEVPELPENTLDELKAKLHQTMLESECYEDLRWTLGDE